MCPHQSNKHTPRPSVWQVPYHAPGTEPDPHSDLTSGKEMNRKKSSIQVNK